MIVLWLWMLLALALGAAAAYLLRADSGYVLLSYGSWVVETSLLGLLLAVLAALLAAWLSVSLIAAGAGFPSALREYLQRIREQRARTSFATGLTLLAEGRWKLAELELVRRAADHDQAHLNYLGAARAAQQLKASDRRDHYCSLALRHASESPVCVLLTQAELLIEAGDVEAARAVLIKLRALEPAHPAALQRLADCQARLADWEALLGLLAENDRVQAIQPETASALAEQAICALFDAAAAVGDLDQLTARWQSTPPDLRARPGVRVHYASGLARLGDHPQAAAVIASALEVEWNGDLVALYGRLTVGDGIAQLATIEQWLTRYGERPELLLTAGQICAHAQLWGKARSYLDAAADRGAQAQAFRQLAELCELTRNEEEAQRFWKRAAQAAPPA